MMSILDEIPAFSIWESFYETMPALMSTQPSEKSAEHLAKIIKSGDFSNIFFCSRDPSVSFDEYQKVSNKYKSFTTWFLGRFFYLLSRKSKSYSVYVDIQLCVLDQLSHTQLNVYEEMAKEYSKAFNELAKFVRSRGDNLILKVFIPVKYEDICQRLNLEPISVEIDKRNWDVFLLNFLKIIDYIVKQNFDFQCYDPGINRILDDLLFLLSECDFVIKKDILKMYLGVVEKVDGKTAISRKMEVFAQYFEQVIFAVYNKRFDIKKQDFEDFEIMLRQFLKINSDNERFQKISEFLLSGCVDTSPSSDIKRFCKKNRKEPLYKPGDYEMYVKHALISFDTSVLCGLKQLIMNDINMIQLSRQGAQELKMYSYPMGKWKTFYFMLIQIIDGTDCSGGCQISAFIEFMNELIIIFMQIVIEMKNSVKIIFIEENVLLVKVLALINKHFSNCEGNLDFASIYDFILNLSFGSSNFMVFFDVFAYVFTSSMISENESSGVDYGRYKKELANFCEFSGRFLPNKDIAFDYLNKFLVRISSGIFEIHQIHDMEIAYMKIIKQNRSPTPVKNLPNLLTLFNNSDRIISEILNPALSSSDPVTLREITKVLPQIICICSSDFVKLTQIDEQGFRVDIYCDKCHLQIQPKSSEKEKKIDEFTRNFKNSTFAAKFTKIDVDLSALTGSILKSVLKYLTCDDSELKIQALGVLPFCSRHILKFHSGNVAKIWVEKAGDQEETVRRKFGRVVAEVLPQAQDNKVSDSVKNEIVEVFFNFLTKLGKKSLQETDIKLQETVLDTIQAISIIKCEKAIVPIIQILIYFIMVPTSRHSFIAVNRFVVFAKNQGFTPNELYKYYKREICEVVAHLCIVNQALVDYSMSTSLCKVFAALGFYSAKDLVSRGCHQLLPFFVAKVIKTPTVEKLLDESAAMVHMGLPEILTKTYGHIFLHTFLNESKDEFKQSSRYLETKTGMSSTSLRKRSLWVILNELLLNFHEKTDKVLLALTFLAREDSEGKVGNVQDFLQSRLLGLLQHFDFKLMAKTTHRKDSILLSLADFFKYMGPIHIGPLRFKIIAMLRTVDYSAFPEITCEVWDAFIRSCEAESLAPQLATIFVSILPLIKSCPRQINDIFKCLLIQNETETKDFIKDLFFVDDQKVDAFVLQMIRKYVREYEDYTLKEKIKTLLKYLSHETSEVRIRSLKQLKMLLEKSREELDQMILGYNGIDPLIVDLIEVLTLGCREKDPNLRLACGEVIGELGAVEPSHLPRKYTQNSRSFAFFLTDDAFVINSLNELTRALQGEKNTVNMDRFALAIQEILKNHEISSDATSSRHDLWRQFPESQQALMLPLLTSRYIVSQPQQVNLSVPIYGSVEGSSFQTWLYNWTRSLTAMLPQEHQAILHPCLPAMKQDTRILMQFLPHIVLHTIVSDLTDNREKMYVEMKTVIGFFDKKSSLPEVEPIHLGTSSLSPELVPPEKIEHTQCTKVVFIILDFLDRWTREWQWTNGSNGRTDQNFIKIKNFLERFCKLEVAKCNFYCAEYPRALLYLEDYITENPHEISNQLTFLTKIYAQVDEPDGVAGVTALQPTEPPIEQRILSLEVSGKLSDAAACYERLPQPLKMHHLKGLIQCYLDLDNVNTALNYAQGALDRRPEFGNMLLEMQAEPLWRLGRYDDLDVLLKRKELTENSSWGVQVGKALLSFQNKDRSLFQTVIQELKRQQVDFLRAASLKEGAYQHGYCYISRLHALNELQQVEKATYDILGKTNDDFVMKTIKNLSKEWELRIKVVQESVRIVEPLLCLRRVAIEQAKRLLERAVPNAVPLLDTLLGDCWLYSAQAARAAGVHQQSFTYTLKAEEFSPPYLFLEKSKLHWLREEHEQALTTLRRGLEILLPDNSREAINSLSLEKRKICAEAKLLIATYNDSVSNVDTDIKTSNYREASEMYTEWENGLVSLAQFYDRRFQNYSDEDRDSKGSDMQIWMISYFCKSLRYGTAYVYQSMPRLLSIWFDYGTRLLDVTDLKVRDERKVNLIKMTKLIDYALENLPAYVFYTAFSQIISRICHPQREVYIELKSIIVKLLQHYPQQSLWMIISVIKSGYAVRARRCAEIFIDPKLKTNTMTTLIKDFTSLAEKLIDLCNKDVPPDVETTTVSALMRALPRLLNKPDFSEIMIPTHKFRKLVLPNPDFSNGEHNAFPNHYVHIVGIDEEVTILRSLQRPRKITLRGSDGKGYIQMLKPKDDLRKDFRLMEFNDIVNQLLSRESESRQRRLNIRLYSVSPLNEECGLIEWVPNLLGLRPIVQSIYKQKGKMMNLKEIRDASCNIRDPLAKKREVFTKVLLPRHPPVLGEWFRRTFPDAQSWFFARTAYIRTTAVISMVGYILGLGDRHGENILFDSVCGDTVHVDFNCLFNKGETFEWPERVPFRLTQNMVAAMGPLGVEGVFRKSCACTLRVLRTNANTLMSIVTPFVYDPLVSWPRNGPATNNSTAERTNEQALDHIKNIELRLQGIIVKAKDRSLTIPLSVDGQTNNLINEAMSVDNLCQMYIGWGPYL